MGVQAQVLAFSLGVSAVVCGVASGQTGAEKPAPAMTKPASKVSPEAQATLDRVRAFYAGLKTVKVSVTAATQMKNGEEEHKATQTMTVSVERPTRVATTMKVEGEGGAPFAMACDGETLWQHLGAPVNKYTMKAAPKTLGEIIDAASFGASSDPAMMLEYPYLLVYSLMDGGKFADMCGKTESITLVGREAIDGVAHERIRISLATLDADLWVRAGAEAWVDKVVPDLTKMFKGMGGGAKVPEIKVELTLSAWSSPKEFDSGTFKLVPPKDAAKVDSLADAAAEAAGAEEDDNAYMKLLGKPAPELGLELLDGGKVTLASHKGKDIVVLDFWATWCPPCVKGLPIVSKTVAEFKDKGVVFYAVNEGETADKVKKFLESKGLTINVLMDKTHAAGKAYKAAGIPETVIIGKDGTVQAVHAGFSPELESELKKQIQTLVDGKTLFDPAKKAPEGSDAAKKDGKTP